MFVELTQREKQVILGTLLGDGSMQLLPHKKSARVRVNQSEKQKTLTEWKYKELKRLVGTPPKIVLNGGYGKTSCRFSTLSLKPLVELYYLTHLNNKKQINTNWLSLIIDPVALAVWYMDDGSQARSAMYMHTEGFSKEEVEILTDWLKTQWKIECCIYPTKNYWRINFSANGRDRFQDIIKTEVIPDMSYKMIPMMEKIYCSMCGTLCEVNRQRFTKEKRVLLCGDKDCSKKLKRMSSKIWAWRKAHNQSVAT
jgi:recombination protein RecA